METQITLKPEYNTLEKILDFLIKEASFSASINYDVWDIRTDANGEMEKCIVLKKSNLHGCKLYFTDTNQINIKYIIPNKTLNALFGKSVKQRQNIIEMASELLKNAFLAGFQKKSFNKMVDSLKKLK